MRRTVKRLVLIAVVPRAMLVHQVVDASTAMIVRASIASSSLAVRALNFHEL